MNTASLGQCCDCAMSTEPMQQSRGLVVILKVFVCLFVLFLANWVLCYVWCGHAGTHPQKCVTKCLYHCVNIGALHKWRQLCCPWRMWCYGNTITYVLFHLPKVMSLMTISLLGQQLFNSISVCRNVEKRKEKNTCRFIFNSHFNFHQKLTFKTCKIYIP